MIPRAAWISKMALTHGEVALISDENGDQVSFSIWNYMSGVQEKSYKGSICGKHCITKVGTEYILTAQDKKQLIHVWDSRKEQIHMKIVCPGKINAMCCSPDGNYCVVALMEKMYIWQVSTGRLMRILHKHYQNVNCIQFTDDGSFFICGGDDNLVTVWSLANVLSTSDDLPGKQQNQKPYHTWAHHSLPVKDIHVGCGGVRCRVVSCSLDQTCKLYDMASGQLLCSLLFDTGLSAVTMDSSDNNIFIGGITGKIYHIILSQTRMQKDHHVNDNTSTLFSGHSKEITALSVDYSATTLLSGSDDCAVRVWHIPSGQCIRKIDFKGKVTNAKIMTSPPDLSGKVLPKVRSKISNFQRTVYEPFSKRIQDADGEGVPIVLRDTDEEALTCCFREDSREKQVNEYEDLVAAVINEAEEKELEDEMDTTDPNKMSRKELVERVEHLENLARKLYDYSAKKILSETFKP